MKTKKAKTKVVVSLLALVGLLGFLTLSTAGDLEPSAPPGPTMKTLDEVEPRVPVQSLSGSGSAVYVIDQPGSYYLTGDVNVVATDKHGIAVEVNDVTIDLMGCSLIGPGSGTGIGIYMNSCSNVEVHNGTVRDFGYYGIREAGSTGKGHRVIGVRVLSNGQIGIYLYNSGHLIKDCTAGENAGSGIYGGASSTVTGNTAYNNGSYGINAISSTVTGNTANSNGSVGISAGQGCTVTGNTANNNGNSATSNVYGIYAGSGSAVTGNTAYKNGTGATGTVYGIYLEGNNLVDQNTAYGNSGTNMNVCVSCTFGTNHAP